ncbi:MAG: type I restriction enzyme HsdR N-terminal domain-containing protein [Firmicutes bacterium]|nr:type I restriction enzyme HsdR N-terminal domain-containing protein [Bacillota bacterium]
MNYWQELCKRLSRKYKSEEELEGRFIDCWDFILGWPYENIVRQMSIQIGHENKRADIVLLDDQKLPLLVIEMKKQGISITDHEILQLQSYMRQKRIIFGLLVGEKLSLYYDPLKSDGKLKRVLNLSFFDTANLDGITLAKLLHKKNFSTEKMTEFCDSYLDEKLALESSLQTKAVIDNLANFKNTDKDKDIKIRQLIDLYSFWLNKDHSYNQREKDYIINLANHKKWITDKILKADLTSLSEEEFIKLIKEFSLHIPNLKRFFNMWLNSDKKILEIRLDFQTAITHLSTIRKNKRFVALDDFIENGAYKTKYLDRSFWSEMIRIRFPDVPLLNQKTEKFFDSLDVYIGDTYEEKLQNVANFYQRFSDKNMTLDMLSHLEHFVIAKNIKNEEGRQFMKANFPNYQND